MTIQTLAKAELAVRANAAHANTVCTNTNAVILKADTRSTTHKRAPITTRLRRRAKPLLGTLVEIALPAMTDAAYRRITDLAFARVAHIHACMSFHEQESDLGLIARASTGDICTVSADTWNVLHIAQKMAYDSGGVFNAAVAPQLVENRLLPRPQHSLQPVAKTLATGIVLLTNCQIKILAPVWIDLGGIAKGYAVDAAITALQNEGIDECVVNAGGDLRVIGDSSHRVALRDPRQPNLSIEVAAISNLACATSGSYFVEADVIIGAPGNNLHIASATVIAPDCAIADALTKVLWLRGASAKPLLDSYDASGLLMTRDGRLQHV
jgi:FAD:protein FMN transferase